MATKRRKSEYTRQRERILNFVRRVQKRGYFFDVPVNIPTERQLRQQGVRGAALSARTRQLQRIKPSDIYSEARFVDVETGEILSGQEGRVLERERRKQEREEYYEEARREAHRRRANFIRTVIYNYINMISRFPPKVSDIVLRALDSARATARDEAVAWALENKAYDLQDFLNRSAAFGDSIAAVIAYCQAMFGDLPGMQDNPEYMSLIEALEEEEGIGE